MSSDGLAGALDRALTLAERGDVAAAAQALMELTRRHPEAAEPWRLLGALALQGGDHGRAGDALAQALQRAPDAPAVWCNLGALARSQGDSALAEQRYRRALQLDPASLSAHNNLGALLAERNDLAGAVASYRAALAVSPGYAPARSNLSACLLALGRGRDALAEADRATTDTPGYAPAWLALGQARLAVGLHADACVALERTVALGLRSPEALYGLAQAHDERGDWVPALAAVEAALSQAPGHAAALSLAQYLRRRLVRHDRLEAGTRLLLDALAAGDEGVAPFAFLSEPAGPDAQRRAAELAAATVTRRLAPVLADEAIGMEAVAPSARIESVGTRADIRVGLVSSGFGQHPTALLVVDLVERLRGGALEVMGYATTADDGGPLRQRLAAGFADLIDLSGLSHGDMAARIRADQPDLLIDLRGWGGGSVAEVFARRPAPVQVNWLAYPGTSGAPWIDYLLADRFVVPDRLRHHYSESVLRLPHCFQPSDSRREVGEPPPRAALGLPEAAPVLACFNNSYKYSPRTLARFWRVLAGVPEAVLWLLDGKLPEIQAQLRARAAAAGIDPERLRFLPKQGHAEYLACYRHADLFLDSTPYNAHTTASDALWAGCPLLTVPGETFADRVAGSLNASLGLDDLNADDDDDFVVRATALAGDRAALAGLRARVDSARTQAPLFDLDRFARDFTAAITAMVRRRRAGLAPGDIDLEPSPP